MTITAYGAAKPNVPGLYVTIVPPKVNYLSPAQTDILGYVGTAVWGPVNAPTACSGNADYVSKFGQIQNRAYDMGTGVWAANLQGAQAFECVRVTDGTDVAAFAYLGLLGSPTVAAGGTAYTTSSVLTLSNGAVLNVASVSGGAVVTTTTVTPPTSKISGSGAVTVVSQTGPGTGATFTFTYTQGITLTSKYTGSGANGDTAVLAAGSQTGTWKLTIQHPGLATEIYDNIGLGLTANALWGAIVNAVNMGTAARSFSASMVATLGTSTTAPSAQTATLAGGSDGVTTITTAIMVGSDSSPRTGMYALRKTGASLGVLTDLTDTTSFAAQVAFGLSEGVYMIGATAAGDTISNAITTKASAGIDSWAFKYMFGDWIYFQDTVNGLTRLISPQHFVAGYLAANQPQYSSLNQQLYGIVSTQKQQTGVPYYDDDLVSLNQAGIDVITNPVPGGSYFGCRMGHNSSSNAVIRGDNYTRMTNFLAATVNGGCGPYVGALQSQDAVDETRSEVKTELDAFLDDLVTNGALDDFLVTCDLTNNSPTTIAQGKLKVKIKAVYLSIVEELDVDIEGGQTVQITRVSTTSAIA